MVINVGIVDEHEIVVAGLGAVLKPYARRVRLRRADRDVDGVDVVLYDVTVDPTGTPAETCLWQNGARLIAIGWPVRPAWTGNAPPVGVEGYICLQTSPADLVEAIERAHRGELGLPGASDRPGEAPHGPWLGAEHGLNAREALVIRGICRGLDNAAVAGELYVSVSTVKTDIRSAYRKIEVDSRAQAVIWGIANGFAAKPGSVGHPSGSRSRVPRPL